MSSSGVRILKSADEVAAQRRVRIERTHTALDCLCIAQYPGREDLWISSPNVPVIPQLPEVNPSEAISYYSDGMLGLHEHYKWPQKYYVDLPHAMAAPANPAFFYFSHSGISDADDQDFPVYDQHQELPTFADPSMSWYHVNYGDFDQSDEIPGAQVGSLNKPLRVRMKAALKEVFVHLKSVSSYLASEDHDAAAATQGRVHGLLNYFEVTARRLAHCCNVLVQGNLTTFHQPSL
ncbi:hypothetical protein EIP91_009252 [Steccherinum ochraceum]|uniref:Uncharacterized protein n=1 Tax=Steccherinum ochraceum TaxID=92696 RepID=A0A4R0R457_9APHY|nr:hypothetical protein EIP91_009252 [Steccherinum ochraceum]